MLHPLTAGRGLGEGVGSQQMLANLLPLGLQEKLELLALDSPSEHLTRLQELIDHLQGELHA